MNELEIQNAIMVDGLLGFLHQYCRIVIKRELKTHLFRIAYKDYI